MSMTELFFIIQESASLIASLQTLWHIVTINSRDTSISLHQTPMIWIIGNPFILAPITESVDVLGDDRAHGRDADPRQNLEPHHTSVARAKPTNKYLKNNFAYCYFSLQSSNRSKQLPSSTRFSTLVTENTGALCWLPGNVHSSGIPRALNSCHANPITVMNP